jgi:hypothetical protein
VAALVLFAAAGAVAQETEPVTAEEARTEEVQPARKKIRVLEDPYDIASFYRSRQTRRGMFLGYDDEEQALGRVSEDPYAIAGYYRSRQRSGAYGYSRFWSSGYGGGHGRRHGFARRIGRNGDLFLFAPTFLAPVGPLTGVFELDR